MRRRFYGSDWAEHVMSARRASISQVVVDKFSVNPVIFAVVAFAARYQRSPREHLPRVAGTDVLTPDRVLISWNRPLSTLQQSLQVKTFDLPVPVIIDVGKTCSTLLYKALNHPISCSLWKRDGISQLRATYSIPCQSSFRFSPDHSSHITLVI